MSYDEFKRCLRAANLTVKDLAALLDMQPNSITNYRAKGAVPRHLAVIATLLSAAAAHGINAVQLLENADR